jgi:hypothetical protein
MLTANTLELQQLESVIERGLQGFYEAGKALTAIRDGKLYKQAHGTFEDYCRERWNLGKSHAYELMGASQVVQNLSATADKLPETERQARPLSALSAEQQPAAWQAAQAISSGFPTSDQVKRSVAAVKSGSPELQLGQEVTVQAPNSPFYGQIVKVAEVDGFIVKAETEQGFEPFLVNELLPQKAPVERAWQNQSTKPDRLEALEATLQVEQLRVLALETMIRRMVVAARAQSLTHGLLSEAEELLG